MSNRRAKTRILCGMIVGLSVAMTGSVAWASPSTSPEGKDGALNAAGSDDASGGVVRRPDTAPDRSSRVSRRSASERAWATDGIVALAIVLGMIVAAALAVKKWGGKFRLAVGSGGENLQVVSRLALSPKQNVCLIRLGEQMVLVGVTPENISMLAVVDDPETVARLMASGDRASGQGTGSGFGRLFAREASSYADVLDSDDSPAEMPMARDRGHYHQARVELSGLLDKIRSRGDSTDEPDTGSAGRGGRGPIAVA